MTSTKSMAADLIDEVLATTTFPLMRHVVQSWRKDRSHAELIAVSTKLVNESVGGIDDERLPMTGVLLLGQILGDPAARSLALNDYAVIENWRVQECLAKAMDEYCVLGDWTDSALDWLSGCTRHAVANVRRAAVEGPRVWTKRRPFVGKPEDALSVFDHLRDDPSSYVRKSVGNSISDISKDYPNLVLHIFSSWIEDCDVHEEVAKQGLRQFTRRHDSRAIELIDQLKGKRR